MTVNLFKNNAWSIFENIVLLLSSLQLWSDLEVYLKRIAKCSICTNEWLIYSKNKSIYTISQAQQKVQLKAPLIYKGPECIYLISAI